MEWEYFYPIKVFEFSFPIIRIFGMGLFSCVHNMHLVQNFLETHQGPFRNGSSSKREMSSARRLSPPSKWAAGDWCCRINSASASIHHRYGVVRKRESFRSSPPCVFRLSALHTMRRTHMVLSALTASFAIDSTSAFASITRKGSISFLSAAWECMS